jgi:hypothetical protein
VIQGVATYLHSADFSREGTVGANLANRGWTQDAGTRTWSGWLRYYPPRHCMSAQVWTAVALGAKGIFCYYYGEPLLGRVELGKDRTAAPETDYTLSCDTTGRAAAQWEELGAAAADVLAFASLLLRTNRRVVNLAAADSADVLTGTFREDDSARQYLIVANQRTGSWAKDSPKWLKPDDDLTIDDQGNLRGYRPAPPLDFTLTVESETDLYDLRSGAKLEATPAAAGRRTYRLSLPPGGGCVLLVGSEEDFRACRSAHFAR